MHNIIGKALAGTKLIIHHFAGRHPSRHALVQFLCANLLPAIDACGAISIIATHVPHGVPKGGVSILDLKKNL
jgi:hypothetical protein